MTRLGGLNTERGCEPRGCSCAFLRYSTCETVIHYGKLRQDAVCIKSEVGWGFRLTAV